MSISIFAMGCMAASLSDYGITLPSSIAVSATSTGSLQGSLVFNSGNENRVGWSSSSGTTFHVWNEHSLPRDSYEVRLVHVSGSLPTSGADVGIWLPATLAGSDLTWRWSRSTPGTTTGSFHLEIRNRFSQQVIASCPVSVNVVYQITSTTFTVAMRHYVEQDCWYDPKLGEICIINVEEFGSNIGRGSGHSISPSSFKGHAVLAAIYRRRPMADPPGSSDAYHLAIAGNVPNLLTSVQFQGESERSAGTGTYYSAFGLTEWVFPAGNRAWDNVTTGSRTVILKG